MGSHLWFSSTARYWGFSHLAFFFSWTVLGQVCIWRLFHWVYSVWPLWEDLENLGSTQVPSSCGWLHMTGTGRWIGWQSRGCHTRSSVLSVIKRRKPSIIFLCLVSSLGSSGSLYSKHFGIHLFSPQPTDSSFDLWWERSSNVTAELTKKGFNSVVILGAWTLWNHRNSCVFDGAASNLAAALGFALEERRLWALAGARGLSLLAPPPLPPVIL